MREGEPHFHQHHPTFMSLIIKDLFNGCNGFLPDQIGENGCSLHRLCTKLEKSIAHIKIPLDDHLPVLHTVPKKKIFFHGFYEDSPCIECDHRMISIW